MFLVRIWIHDYVDLTSAHQFTPRSRPDLLHKLFPQRCSPSKDSIVTTLSGDNSSQTEVPGHSVALAPLLVAHIFPIEELSYVLGEDGLMNRSTSKLPREAGDTHVSDGSRATLHLRASSSPTSSKANEECQRDWRR